MRDVNKYVVIVGGKSYVILADRYDVAGGVTRFWYENGISAEFKQDKVDGIIFEEDGR